MEREAGCRPECNQTETDTVHKPSGYGYRIGRLNPSTKWEIVSRDHNNDQLSCYLVYGLTVPFPIFTKVEMPPRVGGAVMVPVGDGVTGARVVPGVTGGAVPCKRIKNEYRNIEHTLLTRTKHTGSKGAPGSHLSINVAFLISC